MLQVVFYVAASPSGIVNSLVGRNVVEKVCLFSIDGIDLSSNLRFEFLEHAKCTSQPLALLLVLFSGETPRFLVAQDVGTNSFAAGKTG